VLPAGFEDSVCGVTHEHDGSAKPLGKRASRGRAPRRRSHDLVVNTMAIRQFTALGFEPAFSAAVHKISADRYKLFVRLGIGDGAFPKSAKMRQKAPFGGEIHGG
jgi:hypothetical protein